MVSEVSIPENLGKKFMRIEVYVTRIDDKQIITFEPRRFYEPNPALEDFAKKCTESIRDVLNKRMEEERLPLRQELDAFLEV